MSTNKYVISPDLMRHLDEIREAMEDQILSGEWEQGGFADYYSQYQGFRKCYQIIRNLSFGHNETAEAFTEDLISYAGMETALDDEEDEEDEEDH